MAQDPMLVPGAISPCLSNAAAGWSPAPHSLPCLATGPAKPDPSVSPRHSHPQPTTFSVEVSDTQGWGYASAPHCPAAGWGGGTGAGFQALSHISLT